MKNVFNAELRMQNAELKKYMECREWRECRGCGDGKR
jgi:hypothetical protein